MSWSAHADKLMTLLDLTTPPIAVTFRREAPRDVKPLAEAAPSGCTFWKMAAAGRVFYTTPADHHGCRVGAYTHGLPLEGEEAKQLGEMLQTMVGLRYIQQAEVPAIPTLKGGFGYAIYAPLSKVPVEPDIVILRGNPKQLMLAAEAARLAGIEGHSPMRERPTCAMIPEVMQSGRGQPSFACIGNRVYTELGDDEFYFALPGSKVGLFIEHAAVIVSANRQLEAFHRARLSPSS